MNQFRFRAEIVLDKLLKIDELLGAVERLDPYGDIIENFAEFPDKHPPVTKRLIKMIRKDLKTGYWEKYQPERKVIVNETS
jgi:hypothetical protein